MDEQDINLKSRFFLLNEHNSTGLNGSDGNGNNPLEDGAMLITAGIKLRLPPTAENNDPVFAGSFVTAVVDENGSPSEVTTAMSGPTSGDKRTITGDVNESNTIGHVTFSEATKDVQNGALKIGKALKRIPKKKVNSPKKFPIPNPMEPFTVNVRNVNMNNQTCKIPVRATDKVDDFKEYLKSWTDTPPEQQRLTYAGKPLRCGTTLGEYGIKEGSYLDLVYGNRGG